MLRYVSALRQLIGKRQSLIRNQQFEALSEAQYF